MKKNNIVQLLSLVLAFVCQVGHGQPLTVIEQDYEMAIKESRRQNKLLLIDFYTTWCVPCKYLDKTIFKDTAISNEIAKQFVLLKYDAEKDSIHQLSLKHHVSFYPTTMILNKDQLILNRLYGFRGTEADLPKNYVSFLQEGVSRNEKNNFVKGVSSNTHLQYPEFYREYVYRVNTKSYEPKLARYWQTLPASEYFSEIPFAILCYFGSKSDTINSFFLKNRKKYEELYGEVDTRFVVSMIIGDKVREAIDKKDRPAFDKGIRLAKENLGAKEAYAYANSMEEKMLQTENRWKEAAKKFAGRKEKDNIDDEEIASFCWSAWQHCDDKDVLKKCAAWMKTITEKKPDYATLDTYGRLLHKSGNKKQGIAVMQKAIDTGKLNNDDVRSSEEWLKKNKI